MCYSVNVSLCLTYFAFPIRYFFFLVLLAADKTATKQLPYSYQTVTTQLPNSYSYITACVSSKKIRSTQERVRSACFPKYVDVWQGKYLRFCTPMKKTVNCIWLTNTHCHRGLRKNREMRKEAAVSEHHCKQFNSPKINITVHNTEYV